MDQLTKVLNKINSIVCRTNFSLTNGNWNLTYCISRINSIIQIAYCSKISFWENKEEYSAECDVTSFASLFTVLAATISFGYDL